MSFEPTGTPNENAVLGFAAREAIRHLGRLGLDGASAANIRQALRDALAALDIAITSAKKTRP